MIADVIDRWHDYLRDRDPRTLDDLLDDDVVFYSPIVFTPQVGKALTTLYLEAATHALPGDATEDSSTDSAGPDDTGPIGGSFRYTKHVLGDDTAVLEFETTIDDRYVNGVDIIRCNAAGRIVEFRVMIRPLQAVNLVHQQMAAMLEHMNP